MPQGNITFTYILVQQLKYPRETLLLHIYLYNNYNTTWKHYFYIYTCTIITIPKGNITFTYKLVLQLQ